MNPIKIEVKNELLGLAQLKDDAAENLKSAIERVAALNGIDKAVLAKCVAAWHKDRVDKALEDAQNIVDLLEADDA